MAFNWLSFVYGFVAFPVLIAIAIGILVLVVTMNRKRKERNKKQNTGVTKIEETAVVEKTEVTPKSDVINRDELKELIDKKQNYVLIDVREPSELQYGMIPAAKNIPMGEVAAALDLSPEEFKEKYKFDKFTKEDNLIFYCRTGVRSAGITRLANSKGFKARNYKGSTWDWSEIDENVKKYGPAPS